MTNNQTLVLIILTFIILITLVNVIISIIERRKQIAKINTLWDNKLKLESLYVLIHDSMPNITLTAIITMSSHLSTIRLGQT